MIYYVGSYVDKESETEYKGAMPAKLKMDYVIDALSSLDIELKIYSLCNYIGKSLLGTRKEKIITDKVKIRYQLLFSEKFKLGRFLNRYLKKIQLCMFLLFSVKRNDTLLIYHSYDLLECIKRVHTIKKFRWIAEIEELYSFAWNKPVIREKEIKCLMKADAYMCVNHVIADYFNKQNKKVIVSHGAYITPPVFEKKHEKAEVHVVYAGTIEKYKRGAFTAVETARYLAPNKKMHILGFGKEENIKELTDLIEEVNREAGQEKVEYNGKKFGNELFEFLQNCEIGLSSNIMEPSFANHTFPSKAITYVANNLLVVTGYASMFERCDISEYLRFFYEYDPVKIAEIINAVNEEELKINGREAVIQLHEEFIEDLADVMS